MVLLLLRRIYTNIREMSLDTSENLFIVNGVSFDKKKLLQHCLFFKNFDEIDITIGQPNEYLKLLKKWLEIVTSTNWNNEKIYLRDQTMENVYKIIDDNGRDRKELEIVKKMNENELNNILNFLDYVQCDGLMDICGLWYMYCDYDIDKLINKNMVKRVFRYCVKPKYKLVDWVDQNKDRLNWAILSQNEKAIDLLVENPENIDWDYLSYNKNAIDLFNSYYDSDLYINWHNMSLNIGGINLLEHNVDKINWKHLSANKGAIKLLEKNPEKIDWEWLSGNENAIHLLEKNPEKIDWEWLSGNENAIHLLEKNPEKIVWSVLSGNKNAIHLLAKNEKKIDWMYFSSNENAMHILEENMDRIDWDSFSSNRGAMHILKDNIDRLDWFSLSENTSIFEFDDKEFERAVEMLSSF